MHVQAHVQFFQVRPALLARPIAANPTLVPVLTIATPALLLLLPPAVASGASVASVASVASPCRRLRPPRPLTVAGRHGLSVQQRVGHGEPAVPSGAIAVVRGIARRRRAPCPRLVARLFPPAAAAAAATAITTAASPLCATPRPSSSSS